MNESDLRDLMARHTPAPPATDLLGALTARRRTRRRRTSVGIVVAAVAAALVVPSLVSALRDAERGRAVDTPVTATRDPDVARAAYAAAPCPESMPDINAVPTTVPDLAEVVAVRHCPNPRLADAGWSAITAAQVRASATPDALVTGMDAFRDHVARLREPDASRCAMINYAFGGTALAIETREGAVTLVTTDSCRDLQLPPDELVDAGQFTAAFWLALRAQRATYLYDHPGLAPLACSSLGDAEPVDPRREEVVDARWCPPDDTAGRRITGAALAQLEEAWDHPTVAIDPDTTEVDECTEAEERLPVVVVRTGRGDNVTLLATDCGYLAFHTQSGGLVRYQIPLSVDRLADG